MTVLKRLLCTAAILPILGTASWSQMSPAAQRGPHFCAGKLCKLSFHRQSVSEPASDRAAFP